MVTYGEKIDSALGMFGWFHLQDDLQCGAKSLGFQTLAEVVTIVILKQADEFIDTLLINQFAHRTTTFENIVDSCQDCRRNTAEMSVGAHKYQEKSHGMKPTVLPVLLSSSANFSMAVSSFSS